MLIFGGIAVPCAGSCQGHCHPARHTGSTRRAEDAAWSLSWKWIQWFRHISTTHMPIVSHCPSLSPPADFCSTCGAAPLRVCLRKRASQRIDELSDCLLPTMFYKYYVVSCHIMLLLAEPHSRTFLFAPHLVPWLPGATKAEAGHQGCRASGSARDLGHGRHNGTSARWLFPRSEIQGFELKNLKELETGEVNISMRSPKVLACPPFPA